MNDTAEDEEQEPGVESIPPQEEAAAEILAAKNPLVEDFLKKWDRDLPQDRRVYGLKLLFAGAESKKVRDGLYRIGVRHILVSYFYLRGWLKKATVQQIAEDLGRFDFVFLDSGGFTFMEKLKEGKDLGLDIFEYSLQYYEELKRIGHLFSGCAEVDVEEKLGEQWMEDQKHLLLSHGGVPIIPVAQGQRVEHLDELGWFDNFPLIAIGSKMIYSPEFKGDLRAYIETGKERGNLFHMFGATDARTILRSQYYSVDSTSWLGGSRYGITMLFQNGRIRHYDKDKKLVRKRYKRRFEEAGLIWEDIENDKGFEVDMMNALAWKQLFDYVRYNAKNSYWLTPEEQDESLTLKGKAFNADGIIDRAASIRSAHFRRLSVVEDAEMDDRAHETLNCDSCHMSGRCPRYKPENPCGYDINVRLETKADLQKAMQKILEAEYGRVMTGILFEKLEGGVIDGNVSNEMRNMLIMIQQVSAIFDPRDELSINVRAKGDGMLSQMMASVFAPKGSGSTSTQRAARKLEEESSVEVIDLSEQHERELVHDS